MGQHKGGPYRFGLGVYTGNPELLKNSVGAAASQGVLFGVWKSVEDGDISIEFMSGQNRFGYLFFGSRKRIFEHTFVAAGYGIANDAKLMRDWALVRMGIVY